MIVCDSIAAARKIYDGCDGTEYESTANFFDLRYIPDGVEFDDKPKDVCTKIPSVYRPNEFVTDALQHSKVKLTWDETPNERLQFARRAFSRREIEEMDFKAYVASDSDGDDDFGDEDDKDKLREKYRSLLLESKDETGFDSKDDIDMEVTFNPGLSTEVDTKEEPVVESTIEKYKRKERERRQKRMERNTEVNTDESVNESDIDVKKSKGKNKNKKAPKKSKEEKAEEERRKAELELLMMGEDEESNLKHFDMRDIVKAEKQKKNKKVRRKDKASEVVDDFKMDVQDPRFSAVFEHHEFAIDPSKPQFKETTAMKNLMDERRQRQKKKHGLVRAPEE